MKSINRRDFLKKSIGTAAALTVLPQRKTVAANDKIVIGIMGLGGRGVYLTERLLKRPDVEIAYLCDVNSARFARAKETVMESQDKKPKIISDFRKMLDDPSVNAIVNATPDHWHCLGTIMACQAGKDVYVEKPLSRNIWEGRKTVEAARKYKRVVQVGMQTQSGKYVKTAAQYIKSGALGNIHLVRVYHMLNGVGQLRKKQQSPVPQGFDYDMWCGPAPKLPHRSGRWWAHFWDYSMGCIGEDGVHQLDMARSIINQGYPETVCNSSDYNLPRYERETPDTQFATFEYDKLTFIFDGALWPTYMQKTPWGIRDSDQFPDWRFNATKTEIFGTEGFMFCGRHGGGWQAFDSKGELVKFEYGRQPINEHIDNWIDCIRTRNIPNGDVEQAHISASLIHMANISFRLGNKKLEFDPKTETFTNSPDANKYLRYQDREPWIIPENV